MSIKEARETIAAAFREEPAFRQTYVDNVSCVLMDRLIGLEKGRCDSISDQIIKLIFER